MQENDGIDSAESLSWSEKLDLITRVLQLPRPVVEDKKSYTSSSGSLFGKDSTVNRVVDSLPGVTDFTQAFCDFQIQLAGKHDLRAVPQKVGQFPRPPTLPKWYKIHAPSVPKDEAFYNCEFQEIHDSAKPRDPKIYTTTAVCKGVEKTQKDILSVATFMEHMIATMNISTQVVWSSFEKYKKERTVITPDPDVDASTPKPTDSQSMSASIGASSNMPSGFIPVSPSMELEMDIQNINYQFNA